MNAHEREVAIIAAYRQGRKVADIEAEFEVGRSTLYAILKRNGELPSRTYDHVKALGKDAALAGLYELIRHQDRIIQERDETIAQLQAQLKRKR